MIRICTSLSQAGYHVILVGRQKKSSLPLTVQPFQQKRLKCYFEKGSFFYMEYSLRLFLYLLLKKMDAICAIDLDTIIPCYIISRIKKIKRVYDAHELFCEMKEVVSRPAIYKIWKWIEKNTVPHFNFGYTVNVPIANEFLKLYGCSYDIIQSMSVLEPVKENCKKEKFILYQGAVNEGRSFETLIPAMRWINIPLIICGDGNFIEQARALAVSNKVTSKVEFKGMISPGHLKEFTRKAYIGITLFDKNGLSNYYSLANRFFDYIHAGTPQLCVDYPVYREINNFHNIGVLISDLSPANIAKEINDLLNDEDKWLQFHNNCNKAAQILNWQMEEKKLLTFYKNLFG